MTTATLNRQSRYLARGPPALGRVRQRDNGTLACWRG